MKLNVIFLFLSLIVTNIYSHVLIQRINPIHITAAKSIVKKEISITKMYQRITQGAALTGVAAVGWLGYRWYTAAPVNCAQGKLTDQDIEVFRACSASLLQKLQQQPKFPMLAWFKQQLMVNLNNFLVGVAVATVFNLANNSLGPISKYINRLDGIVDRTFSSLFHKNNLEWYITSHVDLATIFNFIEYNAALLEGRAVQLPSNPLLANSPIILNPTMPQSNAVEKMACADLVGYWNLFVLHIEKVLGYMQYKIAMHSHALEIERMQAIGTRITTLVNDFAQQMQTKLDTLENEHIKQFLYAEVQALRAQLGHEISSFSLIEAFKKHDFLSAKKETN